MLIMLILNNQFDFITSMDSLYNAHKLALKGKRNNYFATEFDHNLMTNLLSLQNSLRNQTYKPLPYRNKIIYEPKARIIQAPAYRDRIVHHAIYNVMAPFYERSFIHDSYACRTNLGIHAAARRTQYFLRSYDSSSNIYICQLDISKFYASINHDKLIGFMQKVIDDPPLINLLRTIVESTDSGHLYDSLFSPDSYFHTKGRRGLPIGNLTSQLFANIYLNQLDQYVKQNLKIRQYIRYMDDIVFFHPDKNVLKARQQDITNFLYEQLFLSINPRKNRIYPTKQGVAFVGYKIFPTYLLLRGSSVRHFKKHYRHQLNAVASGRLSRDDMQTTFDSWKAHASHASTKRLIKNLESWQENYLKSKKFTQLSFFDNDECF